jgi:hypothetical protein
MNGDDAALECDLTGTYGVLLTVRAGNCGEVGDPSMLTVPESTSGIVMHTEMQFGRSLVTSTVNKGCSLRLTYEVLETNGTLSSTLNAGVLALVSEGRLEGQANVQRYAPTVPQTIACQGTYEMTMIKLP